MKGYVQVYTGMGKGKTTAALGLSLRAAGAGLRVYIGQFVKNAPYSELNLLKQLEEYITVQQYGRGCFLIRSPEQEDREAAQKGLAELTARLVSGDYDLVIADEINVAFDLKLLTEQELLQLIDQRPPQVELVMTGINAPLSLIERADLVTEMVEKKHYYRQGVLARKGIES